MLTLIRYEMKKTMPIKLVSVALLLIFEVLLLFGSISGNIFVMGLSGMFLIFFSFVVFLLFGLSSMVSLSKDLSTNQGYMLYMLPRPSYQFLLAKIVESLISSICIGLFLYFLFLFDLFYFSVDIDGFSHTFDMIWGLTVENKLGNFDFHWIVLCRSLDLYVLSCRTLRDSTGEFLPGENARIYHNDYYIFNSCSKHTLRSD